MWIFTPSVLSLICIYIYIYDGLCIKKAFSLTAISISFFLDTQMVDGWSAVVFVYTGCVKSYTLFYFLTFIEQTNLGSWRKLISIVTSKTTWFLTIT